MNDLAKQLLCAWAHLLQAINAIPLDQRGQYIADMRAELDELYANLLTERQADARQRKNAK